jgi:hypothetical protein
MFSYNVAAFDIISDLTFGEPLGMLEKVSRYAIMHEEKNCFQGVTGL